MEALASRTEMNAKKQTRVDMNNAYSKEVKKRGRRVIAEKGYLEQLDEENEQLRKGTVTDTKDDEGKID